MRGVLAKALLALTALHDLDQHNAFGHGVVGFKEAFLNSHRSDAWGG